MRRQTACEKQKLYSKVSAEQGHWICIFLISFNPIMDHHLSIISFFVSIHHFLFLFFLLWLGREKKRLAKIPLFSHVIKIPQESQMVKVKAALILESSTAEADALLGHSRHILQ